MHPDDPATRAPAPLWLVALIPLAAIAVYWNSLTAPFVFDDYAAIPQNASIQHLWPLSVPLQPPADGSSATGRPLLNLSYAVNYAIGGLEVRGYHIGNLLIHAVAGLTLFGLVRRTLLQPALADRYEAAATPLALAIALLWVVHPLQTESVVSIAQRTELLMGLFYLLTLYAFVRAAEFSAAPVFIAGEEDLSPINPTEGGPLSRGWQIVAVVACLCGMASKEVMVTAPLMVLLYDRTFVSGTFREAWSRHRGLYLWLAATWLLLIALVVTSGGERGGTVSLRTRVSSWSYLLTQCDAIVRYLKLSFWPRPLILDYGTTIQTSVIVVLQEGLAVLSLLVAVFSALRRNRALGFAGAWFFLILAPSSSILPLLTQTIAEHRMYLPLLAVLSVTVLAAHRWAQRWTMPVIALFVLGFSVMTYFRNADYGNRLGIWRDTVAKAPANPRAWYNLAQELFTANQLEEAANAFSESLQRDPNQGRAQSGLAAVMDVSGRSEEALPHAREGVRLAPTYTGAHVTLGMVLFHLGNPAEALKSFRTAISLKPDGMSLFHAGNALFQLHRYPEAAQSYQQAIAMNPAIVMARYNLGVTFASLQRYREAAAEFEEALRLKPDLPKGQDALNQMRAHLAAPPPASATIDPPPAPDKSNALRAGPQP